MNTLNKTIIATLLIASTSPIYAGDPDAFCEQFAIAAARTMKAHQNGVPMSSLLKDSKGFSEAPGLLKLKRHVVMKAYETTRYSTERMQQKAIAEFRDASHLGCLKAQADK